MMRIQLICRSQKSFDFSGFQICAPSVYTIFTQLQNIHV